MAGFVDLERRFAERLRTHGLRRSLELTGDGLLLGVDTVIATLAPNGEEERILALLAAARGRAVSPHIIGLVRKSVGL